MRGEISLSEFCSRLLLLEFYCPVSHRQKSTTLIFELHERSWIVLSSSSIYTVPGFSSFTAVLFQLFQLHNIVQFFEFTSQFLDFHSSIVPVLHSSSSYTVTVQFFYLCIVQFWTWAFSPRRVIWKYRTSTTIIHRCLIMYPLTARYTIVAWMSKEAFTMLSAKKGQKFIRQV